MRQGYLLKNCVLGGLLLLSTLFIIFIPYNMIRYQYDFENAFDRVLFYPLENTEWKSGFSEKKFSEIRVGMTKEEVLDILGAPLVRSCDCHTWDYVWGKKGGNFLERLVVYGRYGKVQETIRKFDFEASRIAPGFTETKFSQIQVGMTKKEVVSILGHPILSTASFSYWGYTRKTSSPHFARRDIVFRTGTVESIRKRYDFEETEWASGFSEEKFSKIRIGMTKEEVLKIMGKPLIETDNTASYWSYWAYTWDKNHHDDMRDQRTIYFDIHDTVDRIERSYM